MKLSSLVARLAGAARSPGVTSERLAAAYEPLVLFCCTALITAMSLMHHGAGPPAANSEGATAATWTNCWSREGTPSSAATQPWNLSGIFAKAMFRRLEKKGLWCISATRNAQQRCDKNSGSRCLQENGTEARTQATFSLANPSDDARAQGESCGTHTKLRNKGRLTLPNKVSIQARLTQHQRQQQKPHA